MGSQESDPTEPSTRPETNRLPGKSVTVLLSQLSVNYAEDCGISYLHKSRIMVNPKSFILFLKILNLFPSVYIVDSCYSSY